ncbi:MAG TPA: hypothetical protein VNW92_22295, partial [Polyangiaceae bacterium]|nr:hypothetical protein [Polyangiaceae bacterium]
MPPAATEPRGGWRSLLSIAPFTSRAVVAVLTVLALGTLAEHSPSLGWLRIFRPRPALEPSQRAHAEPAASVGEAQITSETRTRAELSQPDSRALKAAHSDLGSERQAGDVALPVIDAAEPPLPLTDVSGRALSGFFRALTATAHKRTHAITRIAHFGDSIVVSDLVSGTLRRKLQAEFGDAGHGFMLIANAWPAYFHNDVTRYATAG